MVFQAEEDEGLTAVADYIEQNNVPIPFLMMLFAHFMSMVIDRLLWLIGVIWMFILWVWFTAGQYIWGRLLQQNWYSYCFNCLHGTFGYSLFCLRLLLQTSQWRAECVVCVRMCVHAYMCAHVCPQLCLYNTYSGHSQATVSLKHSTSSRACTSSCQPNNVLVATPKEFWDISSANSTTL